MSDSPARRLAVMLHTDVIGSTALVHIDEGLAHERIQDTFRRFSLTIEEYGGKTLEMRGDALLAEFGRASDAVCAALSFQAANTAFNESQTDGVLVRLRVGLSLGEVIIADATVTGAGVVLAQRLEQLANAGGVVIQGAVSEAVPTRFPFNYENLGEQELKGFDRPIRAYAVSLRNGQEIPPPESSGPTLSQESGAATESEVTELPDKPSIAVLPFENLSNDPEQEFFADGMSGDIITGLGRIRQFFVIARNTTFSYKGQVANAKTVARELGVRYVLEGSIRKAGNRVRISAQLINTTTSSQLWAERYDRELVDIFDVQDEITANVIGAIEPELTRAEWERAKAKKPENLEAWDYVVRAIALMMDFSEQSSGEAISLLQKGISRDPTYARTYGHKAWLETWRAFQGWGSMDDALAQAIADSNRAIQLDVNEPWAYIGRAFIGYANRDADLSLSSSQKAVELNPSFAYGHSVHGCALAFAGRGAEGLEDIALAMKLSPRDVWFEEFDLHCAFAHFQVGNYEEAARFAERASLPRPGHVTPHWLLMASYGHLGERKKGQDALFRLRSSIPGFLLAAENIPPVYVQDEDHHRVLDGLDKAGVLGV
jgi:TolB-like protein/class 3 adenylate cyclase